MCENCLHQVIVSAIESLANKDFITNVVKNLQIELEVFIQKQVSDATEPLKQRLYLVEQVLYLYEEKIQDFKKRMVEMNEGEDQCLFYNTLHMSSHFSPLFSSFLFSFFFLSFFCLHVVCSHCILLLTNFVLFLFLPFFFLV